MKVLSIDPGKRSLAWAFWVNGKLVKCGIIAHKLGPWEYHLAWMVDEVMRQIGLGTLFDMVIVELPRIYPHDRNKRPNDLIDLAAVAGACSAFLGPLEFVHPRQWKGQTPKDISGHRTEAKLTYAEHEVLKASGKPRNHNILDAIGLGLWWLEEHNARI